APARVPFSAIRRRAVERVLEEFVATAVTRRNVASSYDLTTRAMRAGMTRRQWAKGDIPVYPFPAVPEKTEILQVLGSYRRSVLVDVSLVPRSRADVGASDFTVELRRVGKGRSRRWLVQSFTPLRVNPKPARNAAAGGTASEAGPPPEKPISASKLDERWLLVPLSILALIVIAPVGLGVSEWWRARRAEARAATRRELPPLPARTRDQTSSSRPS
ncbi:MAG: hypothetical protein M3229_04860, partial [Actinomycetota bacterium]|nr:hypothetical protein [Actinomycetota bacterium]